MNLFQAILLFHKLNLFDLLMLNKLNYNYNSIISNFQSLLILVLFELDIKIIFQLFIFFIKFIKDEVGELKAAITIHLSEYKVFFNISISS